MLHQIDFDYIVVVSASSLAVHTAGSDVINEMFFDANGREAMRMFWSLFVQHCALDNLIYSVVMLSDIAQHKFEMMSIGIDDHAMI